MAYEKTIWKNRLVERPRTFRQQQNTDGTVTLVPQEGQIYEAGTPVNSANLQKIENAVAAQDEAITQHLDEDNETAHEIDNINGLRDALSKFLALTGGTLTGNVLIKKGVAQFKMESPDGLKSFEIFHNATNSFDYGTQLKVNGQDVFRMNGSSDVQFFHPTHGWFLIQDLKTIITAQATTPTAVIANGKFVGVYE